MSIYFKHKCSKDYERIVVDGFFMSVAEVKQYIAEGKRYGHGRDFDLVVTYAQSNDEEPLDEDALIHRNSSLLIRRVPGLPRPTIIVPPDNPKEDSEPEDDQPEETNVKAVATYEFDDGVDYAFLKEPFDRDNPMMDIAPAKEPEEDKIKTSTVGENSGTNLPHQSNGACSRFGRRERRCCPLKVVQRPPPRGYVCHRCRIPGHFIQECPTNGDPNYDFKKEVQPQNNILKSISDGSCASSNNAIAAAVSKQDQLLPKLYCPVCKEVMKDAAFTSRCCFRSYCENCIKGYITSRSACFCGAINIVVDDVLPNKTMRDTIIRILESRNPEQVLSDGTDKVSQTVILPPVEFAKEASNSEEDLCGTRTIDVPQKSQVQQPITHKRKNADAPQATDEASSENKSATQSSVVHIQKEAHEKLVDTEPTKKRRTKEAPKPSSCAAATHFMGVRAGSHGHMDPYGVTPYWQHMQPPMTGSHGAFLGNNMYSGMAFGGGPLDMSYMQQPWSCY